MIYFYALQMTKLYVMTNKGCRNWEDVISFKFFVHQKIINADYLLSKETHTIY